MHTSKLEEIFHGNNQYSIRESNPHIFSRDVQFNIILVMGPDRQAQQQSQQSSCIRTLTEQAQKRKYVNSAVFWS